MKRQEFWELLELLDWAQVGNDDAVLEPVVNYLSKHGDDEIFAFDDIMSELLFDIDGKKYAESVYANLEDLSEDDFLYTRCIAIVNGEGYYKAIKTHQSKLQADLEFESVLYVPELAWERRHGETAEYPHIAAYDYETGANKNNW